MIKFMHVATAVALACTLTATTVAAQTTPSTPTAQSAADQAFTRLADSYFDTYYFPTNPSTATSQGLHTYDSKLEDYSRAGIDANVKALQQWETRVSAVDPASLGDFVRGDRELVLNNIHSTLLTLQTIRPWQKNPDSYSSGITSSAFSLMERKFAPPEVRLRALIAREQQMPAALAEARKNLDNPPKIYTQIALEQLPGLVHFFQNDVPSAFIDVTDATLKK